MGNRLALKDRIYAVWKHTVLRATIMADKNNKSVLFVCLGNICRSPIAEAVFAHLVEQKGLVGQWYIDSAATSGWEVGSTPDKRGQKVLKNKGIPVTHIARQVVKDDFKSFNFIFGMDHENMSDLKSVAPQDATAKVMLLGSYDPWKHLVIADPYYGKDEDFERVYQQCLRSCTAFLDEQS